MKLFFINFLIPIFRILLIISLISFLVLSCDVEEIEQRGTLVLNLGSSISRTITPGLDVNHNYYNIIGNGPNGSSFSLSNVIKNNVVINNLDQGAWTLTVESYNIKNEKIGKGDTAFAIQNNLTTDVSISVKPLDGLGTLQIAISWPADTLTLPYINANLKPVDEEKILLPFSITSNSGSFSGSNIKDGYYLLTINLSNESVSVWNRVETIRILANETTSINTVIPIDEINHSSSSSSSSTASISNPTNVIASDGTFTNKITITWDSVPDASKYIVYRCNTFYHTFVQIGSNATTNFEDTTITAGNTYYYKIKAQDSSLNLSGFSEYDSGYLRLMSPTGVTATDGTSDYKVTITCNSVEGASLYYVYRSDSIDGPYSQIGWSSAPSITDTFITPGTLYYYKARAYHNSLGYSDYSLFDTGYATIGIPSGFSASDGTYEDKVLLTWENVDGAEKYYLYRATSSSGPFTEIGNTTTLSFDDTTAPINAISYYKIKPYSTFLGYIDYPYVTTGYKGVTAPTGVSATDGTDGNSIIITCNSEADAKRYYFYRSTSESGTYSSIGNNSVPIFHDNSIEPGKIYYYQVRYTVDTLGYSSSSIPDSGFLKLGYPTGVSATDGTHTDKVSISWLSVTAATSYYIYRSTSSTGTYSQIANTTTLSYDDTSATVGTTYYYKVKAYNSITGYSDFSSYNSGYKQSPAPLSPPTGVLATDGTYTDKVTISWNAVSDATSYYIYRSTSSSGTYSEIGNTTSLSYDDISAAAGTTYYYKVKAYNSTSGYSDFSSYNSGYKQTIVTPLSPPTGVSATDGTYTDKVTISWNSVSAATSYYIYRSTSATGTYSQTGYTTSLSYNDGSANQGSIYYYKVKAYNNASGLSDFSSYNSGYKKILAPTLIYATDGNYTDKIHVSWNFMTGSEQYYVYRSTSATGTYSQIANTTSRYYDDTSANPGTTYYYRIKAFNNSLGYSDLSSEYASGYKQTTSSLPAPTGVSATDGTYTDRVIISWNNVSDATSYYIYRSTSSSGTYSEIGNTTSLSYDDTSAAAGTTYYYKVKAYNSFLGLSDFSTYNSGYRQAIATLSPPSGVTATDGTYTDKIRISWNSVSDATSYYVYRSISSSGTYSQIANTSSLSYDDTSAAAGTTYYYKVKAYNSTSGYSDFSSYNSGYKQTIASLSPPSGVSASDGTYTDKIRISWNSVSGATSYYIYRSTSPTGTYSQTGFSTSLSYDDSASQVTTYYYKVKAYNNSFGLSDFSSYNSGYTKIIPSSLISASDGTYTDKIRISWNSMSTANRYHLYRSTSSTGTYSEIANTTSTYFDDTSASAGTTYYYKIKTYNNTYGYSDLSTTYNSGYRINLSAPTGVSASDGTDADKVYISWNSVSGASKYSIYISDSVNGTYTRVSDATATSYSHNPGAGKIFYYKIKSCSASGVYSEFSSSDSGYRKLSTPSSISASDDYLNYIHISWGNTLSTDRYYIYRSTSSTGTYTQIATATSTYYQDTTVSYNTRYYYKVRSYSSVVGYSDYTSPVSGVRKNLPAPSNVKAYSGEYLRKIRITWDSSANAERYYIFRSTSVFGTYSTIGNTTSTTYFDSSAQSDVTYYYKIQSYHSIAGYSSFSSYSGAWSIRTPRDVTASSVYASRLYISWDVQKDGDSMYVYRSTSANGTYSFIGSTVAGCYNDTSVPQGITYYYKVRSYLSSTGEFSDYSAYASGMRSLKVQPSRIYKVSKGTESDYIYVQWTEVYDSWTTSVPGEEEYQLFRSTNPSSGYTMIYSSHTSLYLRDRDTTPGVTYYYKVRVYFPPYGYSDMSSYDSGYR